MNDKTNPAPLPELSDAAIARIETGIFDEIGSEHPPAGMTNRASTRRRGWLTGLGIAAAFVVGMMVTPPILGIVGGSAMSTADRGGQIVGTSSDGVSVDAPVRIAENPTGVAAESAAGSGSIAVQADADNGGQEIIATANATLQVKDIAKAAEAISTLAESAGGYVEATEVGKIMAIDGESSSTPADSSFGWISVRVPSADLTSVITALEESGEVLSSSISKQDVTTTAIDLRARIEATSASVQRLTELMSQSGSVSELIEAELALTDRQAQLESLEQQLASLDDQVAMSSLHVQLTRASAPATADPAGFNDGLLAGWNGLVASLNGLVIAIGFLLPWLGIAGVVLLVIWLIRRARRTRRANKVSPVDD